MKAKLHSVVISLSLLALSTIIYQPSTVFAQGSLTPPGAPGPTMLTLSQVEPRTPVDATHTGSGGSSEFLITQPGSYYLTANVVGVSGENGINISASGVTLDLNGFSVQGISGVLSGVYIHAGYTNVTVRNGNISGWGAAYCGVECYANNVLLERLNVSANHFGIYLDSSGVVRDCNCQNNTDIGILVNAGRVSGCEALNNAATGISVASGTVADCDALTNGIYGIYMGSGTVSGCTADNNSGAAGIYVANNGTVKDCTASGNDDDGIDVGSNCTINNCTASGNESDGIDVGNNCTVKDCTASTNSSGDGIYVGSNCTVKDCTASANSSNNGIHVVGNDCQISGNTCSENETGIMLHSSSCRIDNNLCAFNDGFGIYSFFSGVGNSITRNSAPSNSSSGYGNTSGNSDYAPIQTPSTATSPWANF